MKLEQIEIDLLLQLLAKATVTVEKAEIAVNLFNKLKEARVSEEDIASK